MQKPSTCFAGESTQGAACTLDLQLSDSNGENSLKLTDARSNTETINLNPLMAKETLSKRYNPQSGEFSHVTYFYEKIENEHEGQIARRFIGYFAKTLNNANEEVYLLKTLTMVSGVIVSLDKKYSNGCRVEAAIDPLFKTKFLVISMSDKRPSYELSETASFEASAMCSLQN